MVEQYSIVDRIYKDLVKHINYAMETVRKHYDK